MNIVVIFGGKSCESEISIITAIQAMTNINKKHAVTPVYSHANGKFYTGDLTKISAFTPFDEKKYKEIVFLNGETYVLKRGKLKKYLKPDVVLNCCHGGGGENGSLQGMLELNDLPYTSCGVMSSAVCMNKWVGKKIFKGLGVKVVNGMIVDSSKMDDMLYAKKIMAKLGNRTIVKPCCQGSSIGINIATDEIQLLDDIEIASNFDTKVLVEMALTDFVEVNCAVLWDGDDFIVSETETPVTWDKFLSFDQKYLSRGNMGDAKHKMPAEISAKLADEIKTQSKKVYQAIGMKGVVRFDFLVQPESEKVFLNEVNTIPGSLAFYLFEPLNISFTDLLEKMFNGALAEFENQKNCTFSFKSTVLENFKSGSKMGSTKLKQK